jgi:hypothetical protein
MLLQVTYWTVSRLWKDHRSNTSLALVILPTELRLDLKRVAYNEFLEVILLINTLLTPVVADTEAP